MNHNWEFDYSNLYNRQPNNTPNASAPQGQPAYREPQPMYHTTGVNLPPEGEDPKAPKKENRWGRRVGAAVALVVFCAGAGFGGGYLGGVAARGASSPVVYEQPDEAATAADGSTGTNTQASNGLSAESLSISQIASIVSPSVVEVTTETISTNPFFPQYIQDGAGSGVIISEDGYIITNAHVISGASQIKVRTSDKTEYEAELIGSDTKSDIAVLKIEATGLTPAVIGDSDKLVVGEFTLAVGNPMGTLGGTVTNGIISALNRDITVQGQTMNLLQTNAAVSPGNSGGGLFNDKGELIGIVNAKSAEEGAEGLGFAIPVNTAMQVAQSLIDNGYVTGRPALGIQVLAVSDWQMMMQYGVSQPGVYIVDVTEGSCADKAGLQAGDLFVSIDGNAVADTVDVTSALDSHAVGDTIEVQVARQGKVVQVSVVLEEQSAQAAQAAAQPSSEQTQQAG